MDDVVANAGVKAFGGELVSVRFLNLASLPLALISRRIATEKFAWGVLPGTTWGSSQRPWAAIVSTSSSLQVIAWPVSASSSPRHRGH